MKLDRSKKYEGLGLTWEWSDILLLWHGSEDGMGKADVLESVFEEWIDAGHIKPVRETKIVRVEGVRFTKNVTGHLVSIHPHLDIPFNAYSNPVTLEFPVEVDA